MFPFEAKCNPRLKRGFQQVFFDFLKSLKNGVARLKTGILFGGWYRNGQSWVVFQNGDFAASTRRALTVPVLFLFNIMEEVFLDVRRPNTARLHPMKLELDVCVA